MTTAAKQDIANQVRKRVSELNNIILAAKLADLQVNLSNQNDPLFGSSRGANPDLVVTITEEQITSY